MTYGIALNMCVVNALFADQVLIFSSLASEECLFNSR